MAPLYRSVPHSAFAAYQLASYHDSGLDFLMIPVDPVKALLLLHLSVEDNAVSAQALNKLAKFYIKGGGGFSADEDFAKHFKTFGKYFQ